MRQNDNPTSARSLAAAWGDHLTRSPCDHFVTLTFAPPHPRHLGGWRCLGPARSGPGPRPTMRNVSFLRPGVLRPPGVVRTNGDYRFYDSNQEIVALIPADRVKSVLKTED